MDTTLVAPLANWINVVMSVEQSADPLFISARNLALLCMIRLAAWPVWQLTSIVIHGLARITSSFVRR